MRGSRDQVVRPGTPGRNRVCGATHRHRRSRRFATWGRRPNRPINAMTSCEHGCPKATGRITWWVRLTCARELCNLQFKVRERTGKRNPKRNANALARQRRLTQRESFQGKTSMQPAAPSPSAKQSSGLGFCEEAGGTRTRFQFALGIGRTQSKRSGRRSLKSDSSMSSRPKSKNL